MKSQKLFLGKSKKIFKNVSCFIFVYFYPAWQALIHVITLLSVRNNTNLSAVASRLGAGYQRWC